MTTNAIVVNGGKVKLTTDGTWSWGTTFVGQNSTEVVLNQGSITRLQVRGNATVLETDLSGQLTFLFESYAISTTTVAGTVGGPILDGIVETELVKVNVGGTVGVIRDDAGGSFDIAVLTPSTITNPAAPPPTIPDPVTIYDGTWEISDDGQGGTIFTETT